MQINTKTIDQDLPFGIYADCIPVKGHNRSLLCDLTRNDYILIPNALYDILVEDSGKTIQELKQKYGPEYAATIIEYFEHLLLHEMVYFSSDVKLLPKLNLDEWDEPHAILHCILDFKSQHNYINKALLESIDDLACHSLQLRFFGITTIAFIIDIVSNFNRSCVENIEIVMPFDTQLSLHDYDEIAKKNLRVNAIIVANAPENKQVGKLGISTMADIFYITNEIKDHSNCGVINPNNFTINLKTISESQKFNTCLNRKISVDTEGHIKNCPSMATSFGNIKDTTLKEALEKKGFKAYWKINKDKIKICRDCEFRHICTDCRAYLEDPKDIFSKPLKCGYDPYTNVWEDWSTNPLKTKTFQNHYKIVNNV